MGNGKNLEINIVLVNFWLQCFNFFFFASVWSKKQLWRKKWGSPKGFQNYTAFCGENYPRRSRWFGLASLHILHVRWSYRGSRALGTNFHFLSVFVVSEKKFMVQGEDKLKGSAQANLERNRQRFERKKIGRFRSGGEHSRTGGEHSRTGGEHSPVRAHTSTRSRSWACRNHKTLKNLWRSKGLWRWVLLSNVRTVSLPSLL